VTVHGTNFLQVENNVTYNTVGHCFFLEDGIEHGNEYIRNLAIQVKCHTSKPCDPTNLAPFGATDGTNFKTAGQDSKEVLIPSDNTVSAFWITNPDNTYRDNVAAGSDSTGFWFAFPEHPTGKFEGTEISKATWPRRMKVKEFKGNVAHSNFDSFMGDRAPRADGHFAVGGYVANVNPADPNSPQAENVIEDFTIYKTRNNAIWARGEVRLYKGLKMADNGIGFTQASGNTGRSPYTSRVVDSLFVGESENIGNPKAPSEIAYGRSLPQPAIPDFPIRAYEFYDYRHELVNDTFVNYQDNAARKTGAISYLMFTSFGMSSNNTVERAKFINAKPVYFPPMEYKWSNDDYGSGSYRTSVFHDKDGSVGGVPDSFIVINGGIALDEACEVKPTWNAAVCKGDVGRMTVSAGGGGGGRGGAPRRRSWRWWRSRGCSCRWWRSRCCSCSSWRGCSGRRSSCARRCRWSCRRPRPCCGRKDRSHRRSSGAGSRSQPQRKGLPRRRYNQRPSGHRVEGHHRTAGPVPGRVGTECRLVGDVRAAGIHERQLGHGGGQPGCTTQGRHHLVLQGQRFAVGQACLHR
jgi:cell migration-inducing and hyaluronan-binding protein